MSLNTCALVVVCTVAVLLFLPSFSLEKKREVIESQVSVNIMLYLVEHMQPWTSRTHTQMHLRWNTLLIR